MLKGREHYPGIKTIEPLEPINPKRVQDFQDRVYDRIYLERAEDRAKYEKYTVEAAEAPNEQSKKFALESRPKSIELEKMVLKINFDILRQIITHIAQHSTLDATSMNFIDPRGISYEGLVFATAAWNPHENFIKLNPDIIFTDAKHLGVNPLPYTAYVLIHEECHATARSVCFGEIDQAERNFVPADAIAFTQAGYIQNIKSPEDKSYKNFYVLFEEGVNDIIARKVWQRYLEQDKTFAERCSSDDIQTLQNLFLSNDKQLHYAQPVNFINQLIQRISEHTGFNPETVSQALIRSKFEAQDMLDPDIQEAFTEIFSPDFLDRLSDISYGDQAMELLQDKK